MTQARSGRCSPSAASSASCRCWLCVEKENSSAVSRHLRCEGRDAPIMPLGATMAPSNTWRTVLPMRSNAEPEAGVSGAGSRSLFGTMLSRTTRFVTSAWEPLTEKVRLSDLTTGARIASIRSNVSAVEERKSIR